MEPKFKVVDIRQLNADELEMEICALAEKGWSPLMAVGDKFVVFGLLAPIFRSLLTGEGTDGNAK